MYDYKQTSISSARLFVACGLVCAGILLLGCAYAGAFAATAEPTHSQSEPPSSGGDTPAPPVTVEPGTGLDAPVSSDQPAPTKEEKAQGIAGHVYDDKGNPIANAVLGISKGTAAYPERAYLTDEKGFYSISLPPGTFTVFANAEGFELAEQSGQVESNRETKLDFNLKPQ